MSPLHKALITLLAPLALPVYQAGQVPDGAAFPYLTVAAVQAAFGEPGRCELTGWHRGDGANAAAAALLDRLLALVPPGGALLQAGGPLLLHRDEAVLLTDGDAVGGRLTLTARCYIP